LWQGCIGVSAVVNRAATRPSGPGSAPLARRAHHGLIVIMVAGLRRRVGRCQSRGDAPFGPWLGSASPAALIPRILARRASVRL
jgi:hypothetical protein